MWLWIVLWLVWLAPSIVWAQDITTGLVAHWKFNEGTGTGGSTTADSAGTNTCTLGAATAAPTWVTGKIGAFALDFDGVNDQIDCGNGTSLNPTAAVTIALWFNPDNTTLSTNVFTKNVTDAGNQYNLQWRTTQRIRFGVIAGGSGASVDTATNISTGVWTSIVAVYNGTDLRVYINGTLDVTPVAKTGTMVNNGQTILIGNSRNTTPVPFPGLIDEVRIYSRALTAADAAAYHAYTETAVTARRRASVY